MTGRYPARFGFEFTAVPKAFARNLGAPVEGRLHQPIYHADREAEMPTMENMGVPEDQITIAELLKGKGYRTLHVGKWHLGEAAKMRPEAQGFDESLGIMFGAGKFLPDNDPNVVNAKLEFDPIDRFLWIYGTDAVQKNGGQRFHVGEYMTDYYTHQAVAAIEANKNRPFFLYLAYNAPHTPLQAKREDFDALSGIKDHNTRVYGAMIRALDRGVGEVVAALKKNGLDDNTLIVFTSDNGGAWYVGLPGINQPYRGWKATFFEGGIRVPYFMRWPGKISAGQKLTMPAHHLDFYGTAAAVAGAQVPSDRKMDTVNLLPFVTGTPQLTSRTLFWRSGAYRVVRQGEWKLQVADNPTKSWLYNLATDPTEKKNLADAEPKRVAAMKAMLQAHDAEMPKPLWPALVEDAIRIDVPLNAPWTPDQEYVYWAN
jgi:arylsulfatase A-like enzyme